MLDLIKRYITKYRYTILVSHIAPAPIAGLESHMASCLLEWTVIGMLNAHPHQPDNGLVIMRKYLDCDSRS